MVEGIVGESRQTFRRAHTGIGDGLPIAGFVMTDAAT